MENKTLAIMQPYVFPYIGYFQLINRVDVFMFYDDVNFIKKGWINRNFILSNDKPLLFTIPLKEVSQNKHINEIYFDKDKKSVSKLLKTFEQSYKKAPFFNEAMNIIEDVFKNESNQTISDLAIDSIKKTSNYLNLETQFDLSSVADKNQNLKGQERILAICKEQNANHYINPIGGIELYDKEKFDESGIKLNFIKSSSIEYKQFKLPFVPNLSIIDLLMFLPKTEIVQYLYSFNLV